MAASILRRALDYLRGTDEAPKEKIVGAGLLGGFGVGNSNRLSENQDPGEQIKHFKHWIYAAVNARATSVAQAKLRVYVRLPNGERREVEASEAGAGRVVQLFNRPNPLQTWWQWIYKQQVYLDLTGDCYFLKDRTGMGRIDKLWILLPDKITITLSAEGVPTFLHNLGLGQRDTFEADQIGHGLYPDPQSEIYGVSPLQAATEAVNVHRAIHESQDKTFSQGADPSLLITADQELGAEQIERIRTQLKAKYEGSGNAGKSLLLGGGLKATPWRMSPKEMNYLESGKMNREELLGVYGVSEAILGILENANRASSASADYNFKGNTITPLLRQWQDLLTIEVCQAFDERLFCEFDSVIPLDEQALHTRRMEDVEAGIITRNEAREERGNDPSLEENADALLVSRTLVPIADVNPIVEETTVAPSSNGKMRGSDPRHGGSSPSGATKAPVQQKADLNDTAGGFNPNVWVGASLEWDEEAALMSGEMAPRYTTVFKGGWDLEMANVIDVTDAPEFDEFIAEYLEGKDLEYFDDLLATTRANLSATLAEGLRNGETWQQMRDRVKKVYKGQSDFRADRIARTESTDAQNAASQDVRTAMKVPFKEWSAIFVNTRDSHASADGQVVPNDSVFIVGGSAMSRPGDLSAAAAETVNCNCTALGVYKKKGAAYDIRIAFETLAKGIQTRGYKSMKTTMSKSFRAQGARELAAFDELIANA